MKKQFLKSIGLCFVIAAFAASVSSCNKGYGCPSNFSVNKVAAKAATTVVNAAATAICE